MTTANASPFLRERKLILGLLLILAAASWAVLIWQATAMNSQAMGMGLTMGMSTGLFMVIWVVAMTWTLPPKLKRPTPIPPWIEAPQRPARPRVGGAPGRLLQPGRLRLVDQE